MYSLRFFPLGVTFLGQLWDSEVHHIVCVMHFFTSVHRSCPKIVTPTKELSERSYSAKCNIWKTDLLDAIYWNCSNHSDLDICNPILGGLTMQTESFHYIYSSTLHGIISWSLWSHWCLVPPLVPWCRAELELHYGCTLFTWCPTPSRSLLPRYRLLQTGAP